MVLYSEEVGWMGVMNISEVQVVVLSEKQEGIHIFIQVERNKVM